MLEMMKGYLQLAAGLGEMSRRKAMDAARELVEGSPVAGLRGAAPTSPDAVAAQVAAVADELLALGRQNRRLLAQVVRTETEAVLSSLGMRADASAGGGSSRRLEDQLRALRDRVDDLEEQLRERAGGGVSRTVTSTTSTRDQGTPTRTPRATSRGTRSAKKATTTTATGTTTGTTTGTRTTPSPTASKRASTARSAGKRAPATAKTGSTASTRTARSRSGSASTSGTGRRGRGQGATS